jgi:hypothetical protein
MKTVEFIHWREGKLWIGYLRDYPDYRTQGRTLGDLKRHLLDLYKDITRGELSGIRKLGELVVS